MQMARNIWKDINLSLEKYKLNNNGISRGFFCHKFGKQGGKNVGGWGRRRSWRFSYTLFLVLTLIDTASFGEKVHNVYKLYYVYPFIWQL